MLLGSLLPMAAPAMVRDSGEVWLGMQVRHGFGDPSRDLGAVLERALATDEPGVVGLVDSPGVGPRLQDLIADEPLDVTVHEGFDWWLGDVAERDAGMAEALEQANDAVAPTARLTSVEAAYWVDAGSKEHLRWVLPQDEPALLDALARLHAAGDDAIGEGSKLVGMFRAHGLVAPGLGPSVRHRSGRPGGAGRGVRRAARRRSGRRCRAHRGSADGAGPAGQPAGHASLTRRSDTPRVRVAQPVGVR